MFLVPKKNDLSCFLGPCEAQRDVLVVPYDQHGCLVIVQNMRWTVSCSVASSATCRFIGTSKKPFDAISSSMRSPGIARSRSASVEHAVFAYPRHPLCDAHTPSIIQSPSSPPSSATSLRPPPKSSPTPLPSHKTSCTQPPSLRTGQF